jgi:prepilin-type N-terminal cleavage/methylation domain-containing protein
MAAMENPVVRAGMRILTTGNWSSLFPSGNGFSVPMKTRDSRPPRPAKRDGQTANSTKGYTLIELVVVVALLGLFLGLAIPRLRYALVTDDVKATTRRLVGLVREVRTEAIREQKVYLIHLDLESNRLWIEYAGMGEEERALAQEQALVFPRGVKVLDVWRRGKGKQAQGEITLHFSKKGYVEQTLIHLGADDGRAFTLTLSPFLGTVKIYDKYVDVVAM